MNEFSLWLIKERVGPTFKFFNSFTMTLRLVHCHRKGSQAEAVRLTVDDSIYLEVCRTHCNKISRSLSH